MKKTVLIFLLSVVIISGYANNPRISFFCELQGKEFSDLFSDSLLIRQLVEMHAALRIGLHDFSPERTMTIRKLNEAGIPLVAWLLLPEKDGYWFNMYNGEKAVQRYLDFKKWTANNDLHWTGVGIDLEPDINDAILLANHPVKLIWKVYKRLYDNNQLKLGTEIYQNLVSQMKTDGFQVESYIIPFIYEERSAQTSSLQKLMGIVDLETENEIPMCYTSAMNNPGIIPIYHRANMPIALGSTGGGVVIKGISLPDISWENLQRDLLIASKLTNDIHIFCIETSVSRGLLPMIAKFDYNLKAPDIQQDIDKQQKTNVKVRIILKILDHPFILTIAVIGIIIFVFWALLKLLKLIFATGKRTIHRK